MCEEILVGIADYKITIIPNKLITIALGSCVGIALYDSIMNVGGLAHIMLPESYKFTEIINPYKFADLAIPLLIDEMNKHGANIYNLRAKIAGGASMFNFPDKYLISDIGGRNSVIVKQKLKSFSIPLIAEDIGGTKGRTMILDTSNGDVYIKTVGMIAKQI